MAKKVNVLVLRTAGTNCNEETAFAFQYYGAQVVQVHVDALCNGDVVLSDYHILALPGGFSYGDDISSGRILANELRLKLGEQIRAFIDMGKLILGICNGFQILVKAGILPGLQMMGAQEATLYHNDSAKFEARWTHLTVEENRCVWTKGVQPQIYLPVAHGEGKFIVDDEGIIEQLRSKGQIVMRYCDAIGQKPNYPDNPNGSIDDIAGICDPSGRVLGLMPHPERHLLFEQHPSWTRRVRSSDVGDGAAIFANGVEFIRKNF